MVKKTEKAELGKELKKLEKSIEKPIKETVKIEKKSAKSNDGSIEKKLALIKRNTVEIVTEQELNN